MRKRVIAGAILLVGVCSFAVFASAVRPPEVLGADIRSRITLMRMTRAEKLRLVFGFYATDFPTKNYTPPSTARDGSAGYVPGVARLGIPPQWLTDGGIGVASQVLAKHKLERTALPSGLAMSATWNPDLAFRGGAMIGQEARLSGFNVMLAGGVNLIRDPRNGRNFEYAGEDPLLAGIMSGAQVAGIQSRNVISTIKHFALNDLETGRQYHDARIEPAQARASDLLALQIAIERGDPGAIMCAYNRVNGIFACEHPWLLTQVLRHDWRWKGYVMSDWGAVHSTEAAANAGLDQESGFPLDDKPYFGVPLQSAIATGSISTRRLDQMVGRILRSMYAHGLMDKPVQPRSVNFAIHAQITRSAAEEAAVLLKNERGILPLSRRLARIAVIGSHADVGVLSGGGSSQTYPIGGNAVPGLTPMEWPGPIVYYPSSPLQAIRKIAPDAIVSFADGSNPANAARLAAASDIAIVFLNQWATESIDVPFALPPNQNQLVQAVAAANSKTVAVLETGGPVEMPWIGSVAAVIQAWYPGSSGGEAIANLLFGKANPSGRLPVTFPRSESQLPRPVRPGTGLSDQQPFVINYFEGAAVGYKWYDVKGLTPLFPFGHGLSYTRFSYDKLRVGQNGTTVRVTFRIRNIGKVAGSDVPQIYVSPPPGHWEAPKRLGGFTKVMLGPSQEKLVTVTLDARLLAAWERGGWHIAPGEYRVMLGASSRDIRLHRTIRLSDQRLPADWRPAL